MTPRGDQKIVAFLDNDKPGVACVQKITSFSGTSNEFNGQVVDDIHVYFYPKKKGFSNANFEAEDYFPISVINNAIITGGIPNTFEDTKRTLNKNDFADSLGDLNKEDFEGFKALFDLILEIKNGGEK